MKKIIMLLLIVSSLAFSESNFSFLEKDKQKHFLYSAAIATAATAYSRKKGSSKIESFFIGFGSALAVGILKEALDRKYGSEDIGDVYADFAGAALGASISAQFEWRF